MNKPLDVWRQQMWREREVDRQPRESREARAREYPAWFRAGDFEREPVAQARAVRQS